MFILIVVIKIITFSLMTNTNIMTGYTYIHVIVYLQVLLGLQCPVAWAKALAVGYPWCGYTTADTMPFP